MGGAGGPGRPAGRGRPRLTGPGGGRPRPCWARPPAAAPVPACGPGGLCSRRRRAGRVGLCEARARAGAGGGRGAPGRRGGAFLSAEGPRVTLADAGRWSARAPWSRAGPWQVEARGGRGDPARGCRRAPPRPLAPPRSPEASGPCPRPHGWLGPTREKGGWKSRHLQNAGLEFGENDRGPAAAAAGSPSAPRAGGAPGLTFRWKLSITAALLALVALGGLSAGLRRTWEERPAR